MTYGGIFVTSKSKMPTEPHYAIVEFSSIHIPGDERSRTNPGHGYPAHSESVVNYRAFTDKEEWEKEVKEKADSQYSSKEFIAIHVDGIAKISNVVQIDL